MRIGATRSSKRGKKNDAEAEKERKESEQCIHEFISRR